MTERQDDNEEETMCENEKKNTKALKRFLVNSNSLIENASKMHNC